MGSREALRWQGQCGHTWPSPPPSAVCGLGLVSRAGGPSVTITSGPQMRLETDRVKPWGTGQCVLTPELPLIKSTMTYAPSGREACCPKGGHVAWPEALVNSAGGLPWERIPAWLTGHRLGALMQGCTI